MNSNLTTLISARWKVRLWVQTNENKVHRYHMSDNLLINSIISFMLYVVLVQLVLCPDGWECLPRLDYGRSEAQIFYFISIVNWQPNGASEID